MPDFPRTHSKEALTTGQPRVFRDDADIRTDAADRSKIGAKAIADVTEATVKWNEAVEKIQGDTAVYNFKTGMMEIDNDAVLDTDITSEAKYQKRREDLRKSVTKGMSPSLINRMNPQLNYMSNVGALGLEQAFKKKTIIAGQKLAMDDVTLLAENPNKELTVDAIKARVAKAVKDGLWDEVVGRKKEIQALDQMRKNLFIQDVNKNPAQAEQNLLDNTYGMTIEELDNAWKVYDRELKIIRNQTEQGIIDEVSAIDQGKTTTTKSEMVEQVEAYRKINKIDANFAAKTIKTLKTVTIPKVDNLTSMEQSNILAGKWTALYKEEWGLGVASFEQRTQFRADVFEAREKGWITQATFNDYLGPDATKAVKPIQKDPIFLNAMGSIFSIAEDLYAMPEDRTIAKAQMSKALMRKVINGANPSDALEEVIAERIEADYPGYKAVDLIKTSEEEGMTVKRVYDLLEKKRKAAGE